MESSSEEQKECVCGGSYLSECSLLPAWLVFLCLKLAITSFKQQLEELLMTQLGRHWGEGRSFPRMKDFPISEQESTQENLFKKKGTDGWVAASMSSQSFQTWILGFLLLEVEFLNRLPSMWWIYCLPEPNLCGSVTPGGQCQWDSRCSSTGGFTLLWKGLGARQTHALPILSSARNDSLQTLY